MNRIFTLALGMFFFCASYAQNVDYTVISVNEESGREFTKITSEGDYVCMPEVRRAYDRVSWFTNRIISLSPDGKGIAFLSYRNNTSNIFVKSLDRQGSSIQRTNRQMVLDFSYSPDGSTLCFSEQKGDFSQIFVTNATSGYVCRQITNGANDFSPVYSNDMSNIFFARQEVNGYSIWSYDTKNNFLSNYSAGMNPCLIPGTKSLLCTRVGGDGKSEIWRIDFEKGVDECIVSGNGSFSTPSLSPDGEWIVFTGESAIPYKRDYYHNTDIYACRADGTQLTQLTFHACEDLCPIWSEDGKYIYFISQRGDTNGAANIWKMNFIY